jgi:hypothetical protein
MCRDQDHIPQIFDFWYALHSLFRLLGGICTTQVGKGYSVTREACWTYGHPYPYHQSSLTFPGSHLSPPLFLQTRMSSIPLSRLPSHLLCALFPTHLLFQAYSRCTSEGTILNTVKISPTGVSMGFNEFPGLPDRFTPCTSSSDSHDDHDVYDLSPEQRAPYGTHVFPEIE